VVGQRPLEEISVSDFTAANLGENPTLAVPHAVVGRADRHRVERRLELIECVRVVQNANVSGAEIGRQCWADAECRQLPEYEQAEPDIRPLEDVATGGFVFGEIFTGSPDCETSRARYGRDAAVSTLLNFHSSGAVALFGARNLR
jgi:hypothetical protein